MKRQSMFSAAAIAAVLTVGASSAALAQQAPVYGSWGMTAPGMQVGISNAPMRNLPTVVYSRPVAAPMSYGFGYGVDPRNPYGHIYSQNYAPGYGYGQAPARVVYGAPPDTYGHDRDDFRSGAWAHERQERHEWAERRAQHEGFEHTNDHGNRPGARRF
jgi:hypothetical protein